MTRREHQGPRAPRPRPRTDGHPGASAAPTAPAGAVEHLQDAIRHANELEAIFAAHADALIIYSPDGEILRVNPAGRELLGLAPGETPRQYRQRMSQLAPVDEHGAALRFEDLPSRRALRGELVKGVVVGLHQQGRVVWTSVSAAPLRGPDGAIAGAVVSDVDVTHLRRLQEEREQVVRALTHEARTRLNVIQAHGELLARAPIDEGDARRRAEVIVSSARQLAAIIDALVEQR